MGPRFFLNIHIPILRQDKKSFFSHQQDKKCFQSSEQIFENGERKKVFRAKIKSFSPFFKRIRNEPRLRSQ
jgi:hypothetical protein